MTRVRIMRIAAVLPPASPLLLAGTLLLGAPVLLASRLAAAANLYEVATAVTGMDLRSRPGGFTQTLAAVLAKTSGNPAWFTDPRVAAVDPRPLLLSFVYTDRESALPKHDEQGTRDRLYTLHAFYDPSQVDALLHRWQDAPWPAPRPTIVVDVTITPRRSVPIRMQADTDADEPQRAALIDAADALGLSLAFPAALDPVSMPHHAPRLTGTLEWSDADFGWVAHWHMAWDGRVLEWGVGGVGFDAAYRDAAAGAARFLSGH